VAAHRLRQTRPSGPARWEGPSDTITFPEARHRRLRVEFSITTRDGKAGLTKSKRWGPGELALQSPDHAAGNLPQFVPLDVVSACQRIRTRTIYGARRRNRFDGKIKLSI